MDDRLNARVTPASEGSFDQSPATPVIDSEHFALNVLDVPEHTGISPLYVSTFEGYEHGREEFLRGAEVLGLNTTKKPLQPQQYVIADALNSQDEDGVPLNTMFGVCVPRRASKTTSIYAVALGRMMTREDYRVVYAGQSQKDARTRWLDDVVTVIERKYAGMDKADIPWYVNRGAGSSHIIYKPTGSTMYVFGPDPAVFRGNAFDMVILDESQEIEPGDPTDELLGAILPTFDTRHINGKLTSQLIVTGTAGEHRSGLLWDTLELGRQGKAGIVEYAAPETTPVYDVDLEMELEGSTADPEIWKSAHPGLGNLTPLVAVEGKLNILKPDKFAREYLGIWPHGTANAFISPVKWDLCAVAGALPPIPTHFALAMQAHHEQTSGSIVAAWRDADGHAIILELETRKGVKWMAERAAYYSTKYKTPVIYDKGHGPTSLEAEQFNRFTPRPRTDPQLWTQVSNAAALLVKEIETANLRHYNQPGLNAAVPVTVKRGTPDSKRWALGRRKREDDITPIEAAALALRAFDEMPVKRALPRMTA